MATLPYPPSNPFRMKWPRFTDPSPNAAYNFSYQPRDVVRVRLIILVGLLFMGGFVWIYAQPTTWGLGWLYALLSLSIGLKLLRLLHEWYHVWQVAPPTPPPLTRTWTVDVMTTFCPGEPYDMVLNSLRAIQAIRYPHTTYLCDEANDPYLREQCQVLGVIHVTRTDKTDAKAGNINNALRQATGEIVLILDPDHVPVPDFLDQVLPYFENPDIGFVQCVQGYYNRKESLVAFAAAEQTYTFYGPMMATMSNYGTAQAIGANCTFRRDALDAIGGHAPGLSEDMHTAMRLHAAGWQSTYVPLPLSYGLVPATLSAYYKQQLKWSRGTFELLLTTYPRLFSRFSWRQRLHYFMLPLHYLLGLTQLIDLLIPILSLVLMRLPLRLDLLVFAAAYFPLLATSFLIRQYAQRWLIEKHEAGFHVLGGVLSSGTWWVYLLGIVYTLFRVEVPYLPTPKDDRPQNNFWLCLPNLTMALLTLGAIGFSAYHYGRYAVGNPFSQLIIAFGLLNVLIMSLNVLIGQELLLAGARSFLRRLLSARPAARTLRILIWKIRYGLYRQLRLLSIPLLGGILLLTTGLVTYTHVKSKGLLPPRLSLASTQPFYYGLTDPQTPADTQLLPQARLPYRVIRPQHLRWLPGQPIEQPHWSDQPNQLPLLYLEPAPGAALTTFLRAVGRGQYDAQLGRFFGAIATRQQPVLLSFAPEYDDTTRHWGTHREADLILYAQAWRHVVEQSRACGLAGSCWLWCPARSSTIVTYYPGDAWVDWLGLTLIDQPGHSLTAPGHSFGALYQPVHNTIRMHQSYEIRQKPILMTRIQSGLPPDLIKAWFDEGIELIHERYPEVRGLVLSPKQAGLVRPGGW
ncbi:hypothetical protein GCM10027578_17990 [Spirosoma luteolum]